MLPVKVEDIIKKANQMFDRQAAVKRMWQSIADNFYPMRADFDALSASQALTRPPADWLADSYPTICMRDLGNSIEPMLRDGNWFEMQLQDGEEPDQEGKIWLANSTRKMRAYMGQRESGFSRAVKQGDMDYMAFGQCVIQPSLRGDLTGPLYQNWHLRDCAWFDDEAGNVGGFSRVWRGSRHQAVLLFGKDRMHRDFVREYDKEPFGVIEFYHVVLPPGMCGGDQYGERFKYVSYWVDKTHQHLIEDKGQFWLGYVVPRFLTLAESPYAYSPATMCALPDARTLQAQTFTLLEAAERFTNPPMLAAGGDVIQGVIDLSPNGITYFDNEYDERSGQALRALAQDKSGFPIGQHERSRVVETITRAFYLDRITMPQKEQEMTAYEVAEMMKQYRRQNLPLFQPIEVEYNGQLCEATFDILMRSGHLGRPDEIPDSLLGKDVRFKYRSPLSAAEDEARTAKFGQLQVLLTNAIGLDQNLVDVPDLEVALRDAIAAMDVPPEWIRKEQDYEQALQARQAMQAAQMMAGAADGAEALPAVQ